MQSNPNRARLIWNGYCAACSCGVFRDFAGDQSKGEDRKTRHRIGRRRDRDKPRGIHAYRASAPAHYR